MSIKKLKLFLPIVFIIFPIFFMFWYSYSKTIEILNDTLNEPLLNNYFFNFEKIIREKSNYSISELITMKEKFNYDIYTKSIILDSSGNLIDRTKNEQLKNYASEPWFRLSKRLIASGDIYEIKGKYYHISCIPISDEIKLFGIKYLKLYNEKLSSIYIEYLFIFFIFLSISFIIGRILSGKYSENHKVMIKYLEKLQFGGLNIREYDFYFDELNDFNERINNLCIYFQRNIGEVRMVSKIDGLTNIFNQKTIKEKMIEETILAKKYGRDLSIIMIDIDFFKKVNDVHGHQKGDEVISKIAEIINKSLRKNDYAGRYGGEEYLIVLPGTSALSAGGVAERIRKKVDEYDFNGIKITISAGIAELENEESHELILKADKLLYKAKNKGRNRIEF